jgi:antitoxin SocA-like protein
MEYGPVPSASLNVMNDVIAHDSQYPPVGKELFAEYVTVERFFRKHPVFRAKKKPDLDVFSDSDIEALEYALKTSGSKSSWQLSQEWHDQPAWKAANEQRAPGSSVIMDYRLFFEGHPEAADMLRLSRRNRKTGMPRRSWPAAGRRTLRVSSHVPLVNRNSQGSFSSTCR